MAPKRAPQKPSRPARGVDGSSFAICPVCEASFPLLLLPAHASACEGAAPASKRPRGGDAAAAAPSPAPAPPQPTRPPPGAGVPSALDALRYTPAAEVERFGKHTAKGGAGSLAHGGVSAGAAPGVVHRTCGVQGHLVVEDFMSEAEEETLLSLVENEGPPWSLHTHNGRHFGKSWGVRNLYSQGVVLPADPRYPFPPWLAPFVERIRTQLPALRAFNPNEVNAIWYSRERGDTLSPHVDNRHTSGDIIVNLSLAGSCTMTYAPMASGSMQEPMRVLLPRRCMQVQSYAARYSYTHGIRNEDLDEPRRVSLTMRESPLRRPGV